MFYDIMPYIQDFEAAYSFLKEKKVLNNVAPRCLHCQKEMSLIKNKDVKIFRCSAHKGEKESIRKSSFLEYSKLRLQDFILLTYLWSRNTTVLLTSELVGLSISTVTQWYQYMRDITSDYFVRNPYQIGGPGHIVEIDEPMMCKRKYKRGRMSQERWVFGGWDRDDKIGFLAFVPDCAPETLLFLIKKYIKPGTTIHSNRCSASNRISEINVTPKYILSVANQTENCVDPAKTDLDTNTLECYWRRAKQCFKNIMGRDTEMVESYLNEFLWREQYGRTGNECFENILKHISEKFTFQ
ncbi:uncharacterized protein LOC115226631 [Octopus sinensis]|uniref:Uncharacterized protein LOC115226631 n=1 Tax=Octopus sinensis TaxID=2607531 RepID=A0A6P7TP89_9MOLL|nr:uncharacterized protein LOC115226631 [Octopus sinensis]